MTDVWRTTYRLAGNAKTAYHRDFDEEQGVLRFTDVHGERHIISPGTPYVTKEAELPEGVKKEIADESDTVTGVTTSDAPAYDPEVSQP